MKLGSHYTSEQRAEMSASRKGQPGRRKSDAERAKISASLVGNTRTKGLIHSADARDRMSAGQKGHKNFLGHTQTAEARAKTSAALSGRTLSTEHRSKLSLALIGKKRSPEFCAMRRSAQMGKRPSAITREKMSESQRKAWFPGKISVAPKRRYTRLAQSLHQHLGATGLALEIEVRFGRFTVDLYDRAHHVAYEADGTYWHEKSEARRPGSGAARDAYLVEQFGLKVVHYTDKEIGALTGWPKKRAAVA